MSSFQKIRKIFWSESFWLPGNHTWDDLKNTSDDIYYPQLSDLVYALYISVFISLARILFDRYVAESLGARFGLKVPAKKVTPNPTLEAAFTQKRSPSSDVLQSLAKQTDLTRRQVERWFRVRRNQERTPVLKKFKESAWRFVFYLIIFWYGMYVHLDKVWFYETVQCWKGWPYHAIGDDVYWYYLVELGFYFSLLYSLFSDVKRKDFTEMIVHHVATILLLGLSWVNNFVRMGTLILLVHDAVDSWMEAAKVAKYISYDKLCEGLFFTFMVIWVITRLIIFPFRIIYSTVFEALPLLGGTETPLLSIYSVYNSLLIILQILHVIWFYYICLIAKEAIQGEMNDSRSSMESASDSDGKEALKHSNAPSVKGKGKEEVTNGQVPLATKKSS